VQLIIFFFRFIILVVFMGHRGQVSLFTLSSLLVCNI